MATKLVTSGFKKTTASSVIGALTSSPTYLFVGKHTSYTPDDQTIPTLLETEYTITTVYNDIEFGKKVTSDDIIEVVPRYDWTSGTAYSKYDHLDDELLTKSFYACVNAGSFYHVYKCLDNNGGANSTVEPTGQDLEPFISPVDGYQWKYLYSYTSAQQAKFSTDDYMPVTSNSSIVAAATGGSIDVITITEAGSRYDNWYNGAFRAEDIMLDGESDTYGLPADASNLSGFYQNCVIKVTSGPANNEYREITSYTVSGTRRIVLESPFNETPLPTNTYEICPLVKITGDGNESVNCVARAIVDDGAANSISNIEILEPGAGYRVAGAEIFPHAAVGVTDVAEFYPIISPVHGHGYNPIQELGSRRLSVSVTFTGDEFGKIPVANDWRRLGLLQDPRFANVHVALDPATRLGNFADGESIYSYKNMPLIGTVTTVANSAVVSGNNTAFDTSIEAGNIITITDGESFHLSSVTEVVNSSCIILATNCDWANTTSTLSLISVIGTAEVVSSNSSIIVLDNCSGSLNSNFPHIVGVTSFASAKMDTSSTCITLNGENANTFTHFVQLQKFTGTIVGTFEEDETVIQGSGSAKLFSAVEGSPDYIYISNPDTIFASNVEIVGTTSGAAFTPTNKYDGALDLDSGEFLYIENVSPVTRASNKSEQIKIIFEF